MESFLTNKVVPKSILAGGSVLLALAMVLDVNWLPFWGQTAAMPQICAQKVQPQAKLSRQQIARLLTVQEGDRKQRIRDILKPPYCTLSNLQVRAGATAQREAYPLEFDPHTWLIVLYEGEQYVGYRFNVQ